MRLVQHMESEFSSQKSKLDLIDPKAGNLDLSNGWYHSHNSVRIDCYGPISALGI